MSSPAERRAAVRVRDHEAGREFLDHLAARFTYKDREAWRKHVLDGSVTVNGAPAPESRILAPGDLLEYRPPEEEEPPVRRDFSVLYKDSALLVVEKPGDLPCHPGGRYFKNTLWWLLRESCCREDEYLSLVNRIDRESSGIVLAARSRWAAGEMGRQFQKKMVFKRYLALVEGRFPPGTRKVEGRLAPDLNSAVRKRRAFLPLASTHGHSPDGEICATTFRSMAFSNGVSLVEALPHTGRLHQIRATLFAMGFPLVGDKIYGPDEGCFLRFIDKGITLEDEKLLRLSRQALHAAELRIRHPASGSPLRFHSEIPRDMAGLLEE